jgi:hypothetical protein
LAVLHQGLSLAGFGIAIGILAAPRADQSCDQQQTKLCQLSSPATMGCGGTKAIAPPANPGTGALHRHSYGFQRRAIKGHHRRCRHRELT